MLTHAWLIPAIPAVSFVLILLFGKKLPRGGSEIGIAAIAIAFVLAVTVGVGWIQRTNHPPSEAEHAQTLTRHSTDTSKGASDGVVKSGWGSSASGGPFAYGIPGTTDGSLAATSAAESHGKETAEPTATEGESNGEQAASGGGEAEEEHHTVDPVVRQVAWFETGDVTFTVGTLVDGLSAVLMIVVTIVSLLVHVYSTDYVDGDRRYTHFFAFLSLFTAAMLFFVLSESTLQMIVGWELVGVCSFVLIGHWWEEKPNSDAALKAFLTNRVGDVGLLIGVITLFFAAGGSFSILRIDEMANAGEIRHVLLLIASCCLMAAVMSKSGQFVLHTWLPDAMAGPTPVSALIHAATMVVAGIYMIARLYAVFWQGFQIGHSNVNVMAVIGGVTVVFGALLAFVQRDIKKVLAYSTISQLGYMVLALGVGAWTAAIFHLFTHAFFKAGLFLGAGSVSHHIHSFDMKKDMGGMRKRMPITFWTFMICTGALMGIFPLAGFWSKDEVLAGANGLGGPGGYKVMLVMGLIGAFLTCAYMTRTIWYTFFGEPRGLSAEHEIHENGPRITVPLIILSGLAVIAGLANIPHSGIFSGVPTNIALQFEHYVEPTGAYFPGAVDAAFRHPEFSIGIALASTLVAVVAVLLSYLWYWRGLGPHGISERNRFARFGYQVLENKYYLDWLYTDQITAGVKGPIARASNWVNQNVIDGVVNGVGHGSVEIGRRVYDDIDQGVVDTVVKGSGAAAEGSGQILRKFQTGKVQQYGAYLFLGATVLAAVFVFVSK